VTPAAIASLRCAVPARGDAPGSITSRLRRFELEWRARAANDAISGPTTNNAGAGIVSICPFDPAELDAEPLDRCLRCDGLGFACSCEVRS
jgi:hypothetical protein